MSRHVYPYKGARVERRASGVIPEGPHQGEPVTVTLHLDHASHGFRTNYQTRPKRWLTIQASGATFERPYRQCWAFSGNRFEKGAAEFDRACGDLKLTPDPVGAAS